MIETFYLIYLTKQDKMYIFISDLISRIYMLKIQKNIEYALLALRYIHQNEERTNISSREISETLTIPYELLSKILQKMVKSGLIISVQGKNGGYRLDKNPSEISIITVMESLEQKVQLTDCLLENAGTEHCKRVNDCCLRNPLISVQNKINDLFGKITLSEIIN